MVSKKIKMSCCKTEEDAIDLPPAISRSVGKIGGVNGIARLLPDDKTLESISRMHEALSDTVRLKILLALSLTDLCPCVLKRIADVTDSKLSYHLKLLENASLIESARDGRWVIYTITQKGRKAVEEMNINHH